MYLKFTAFSFQIIIISHWTQTQHTNSSLSENNRQVTYVPQDQSYPEHPDRFDGWYQVLCTEGLTGRCYWEVEWSLGVSIAVTYRGISRKGGGGDCRLGHNDQSWRLDCRHGDSYTVRHNSERTDLPARASSGSNRAAVFLDCPAGTLSFYTVSSDSLTHLYTFTHTRSLSLSMLGWGSTPPPPPPPPPRCVCVSRDRVSV